MILLPDGEYDTLIIDADRADEATALELTIVAGPHKGEVVSVRSSELVGDPIELLGIPATLTVTEGQPHVRPEP